MKYSIIIPTYNAIQYTKDAIASVINQNFDDYELIVSDNKSDDGTYEYVKSLHHEKIKLIQPDSKLAMHDHWEFAIAKAQGDWITVVGSDDGLMPHYFKLAEYLTALAKKENIEVIGSHRGYYFWDGCQDFYGDLSVLYGAAPIYRIRNSRTVFLDCCLGFESTYTQLPHMYTSSIIHKNLLQKIRQRQSSKLFLSLIPDAHLACNITLATQRFIHSSIPLGWVGASSASGGLNAAKKMKIDKEANDVYTKSSAPWNPLMGKINGFIMMNMRFLFFESVLNSRVLPKESSFFKILHSKFFGYLVFANVYAEINKESNKHKDKELTFFYDVLAINSMSLKQIKFTEKIFLPLVHAYFYCCKKIEKKIKRAFVFEGHEKFKYYIEIKHSETDCHCLMDAWNKINELNSKI